MVQSRPNLPNSGRLGDTVSSSDESDPLSVTNTSIPLFRFLTQHDAKSITLDDVFVYYQKERPNSRNQQIYDALGKDLEAVLDLKCFEADTMRAWKKRFLRQIRGEDATSKQKAHRNVHFHQSATKYQKSVAAVVETEWAEEATNNNKPRILKRARKYLENEAGDELTEESESSESEASEYTPSMDDESEEDVFTIKARHKNVTITKTGNITKDCSKRHKKLRIDDKSNETLEENKKMIFSLPKSSFFLLKVPLLTTTLARSSILNFADESNTSCMAWIRESGEATDIIRNMKKMIKQSESFNFQFDKRSIEIAEKIEQAAECEGVLAALIECKNLKYDHENEEIHEEIIDIYTHMSAS
ncbi:1218_t:CDS:2, partial [Paraglomus occultum]